MTERIQTENRIILALDFPDRKSTLNFLTPFRAEAQEGELPFVKVGMELFDSEGPDLVRELRDLGYPIFLDLKLHDIPHTVEQAMRRLSTLGVSMTNVHAAGGSVMMKAAREGFGDGILIAVTQLTSTSEEQMQKELLIDRPLNEVVLHYARLSKESGLDGVVCSPLESPLLHEALGDSFLTVTPGIRFADGSVDDQKRITTPRKAGELGSSYIVVGRAVTKAEDPIAAYRRVKKEFGEASQ